MLGLLCCIATGYESEVAVDEYTNPGTDMQGCSTIVIQVLVHAQILVK